MTVDVSAAPRPALGRRGLVPRLLEPQVYLTLAALSLLLIIPAVTGSDFITHVFVTICVFAALSTAWNILGGYAGQLSLGQTVFYGIGRYTAAATHMPFQGVRLNCWMSSAAV